MARTRNENVAIHTALRAVDKFTTALNPALIDGEQPDAAIDYEIEYTYISPSGVRQGVSKEHLEGSIDGWPMPGHYEIFVLDSNGEPLHQDPFRAVEHDKDALIRGPGDAANNPAMQLFSTLAEEARLTVRGQRAELNSTLSREKEAREAYQKQIDVTTALQREKSQLILTAERAVAEKELAEERLRESEAIREKMETDIAEMKPQFATIVDRGLHHFGRFLGLPSNETEPGEAQQEGQAPPARENEEPRPECAADPQRDTLDLLAVLLGNDEVLASMVQEGLITWNQARSIWWGLTGKDLGDEPNWDEWHAAHDAAEPQEGAA
jgi:hypothetical protein